MVKLPDLFKSKEDAPSFKIPPRRVLADECKVVINRVVAGDKIVEQGEPVDVHIGEWIEVLPVTNVLVFNALVELSKLTVSVIDNKGLEELCEALSERITDWNFTGLDSKPLPKPYKNPKIFMSMTEDELIWLVTACQGETPGERKKD